MGRSNPVLVAAAMLGGVAARYAQSQGSKVTRTDALAEIAGLVLQVDATKRQAVLNHAAAGYTGPGGLDGGWYYADALALLIEAGADEERARQIQASRGASINVGGG